MSLFDALIDPLVQYGFMRVGLAAAVVVGVSSAVLSCLLVVRHQALLGDAISHAVLLGVAVGYLVAGQAGILGGAMIVAVATGLLITYVERNSPVKRDAVMGIVFTAAFALGLAIISVAQPRGIDLFHILLGNVLGVSSGDLVLTTLSGGLVVAVVLVLFRPFHLWSFDPLMAQAVGLPVRALECLFTALLSATVVASLQAVGLILVIAMLITPGATALLVTTRLSMMMAVASGVGLLSAVGGLYGSYYVDVASGPAIVLVASVCFVVAFLAAPRRGIIAAALRRRRAAHRIIDEDLVKVLFSPDDPRASTDIAALLGRIGAQARVVEERLAALSRRRLVVRENGQVHLTGGGREEALRMVRTHRLLESYAARAEGVPLSGLHDVADELEHQVSQADLADMDRMLGAPTEDPHGHPIPSPAGPRTRFAGRTLAERPIGERGVVAMVADDRADLLDAMVALGVLPRRPVTVLRAAENGGLQVLVSQREVDVPADVAARVFVVPAP